MDCSPEAGVQKELLIDRCRFENGESIEAACPQMKGWIKDKGGDSDLVLAGDQMIKRKFRLADE